MASTRARDEVLLSDTGDITLHIIDTKAKSTTNISISNAQCDMVVLAENVVPILRLSVLNDQQGTCTTGKRKKQLPSGWTSSVLLSFKESTSSVDVSFGWIIIEPDKKENPGLTRILLHFEKKVTAQDTWWKSLQMLQQQQSQQQQLQSQEQISIEQEEIVSPRTRDPENQLKMQKTTTNTTATITATTTNKKKVEVDHILKLFLLFLYLLLQLQLLWESLL